MSRPAHVRLARPVLPGRPLLRVFVGAPLLAWGLLVSGCATRRTIEIDSVPRGATVQLDGQRLGVTPLEYRFDHYGTRRITLYREGYRRWSERVEIKTPWYALFPLDILTEVVVPLGLRDEHKVKVTLAQLGEEVPEPDLEAVLARARAMRESPGPIDPRRAALGENPPPERE